jgi:hypothetical protein
MRGSKENFRMKGDLLSRRREKPVKGDISRREEEEEPEGCPSSSSKAKWHEEQDERDKKKRETKL